jgi:hypothetical protein
MIGRIATGRWLFRLVCGLALLLLLAVLAAPLVHDAEIGPKGFRRLMFLFAHDATIRRTCIASAMGLLVTACVFFRPSADNSEQVPPPRKKRSDVAGA